MKTTALCLALVLVAGACRVTPEYGRPLPEGAPALLPLKRGERRPDFSLEWYGRHELLPSLERSIEWTRKPHAQQFFPIEGVSHARALASLERFRELLMTSSGPEEFERWLEREFVVYKSAGWNGKGGGVLFTGYCTPILDGSPVPKLGYDYPLYALPPDLVKGAQGEILGRNTGSGIEPYPTRSAIEASQLLGGKNLELVWLTDPLDAFIAHVNGSAFVRTADGEMLRFGYAGKNGREYSSLGRALVAAGELTADEVSLPKIREWGRENPDKIKSYLQQNDSFVFFTTIAGNPRGSLNVEVAGGRTIATDKTLFPRGAVVFVDTELPGAGNWKRFMMDQDTGGAIRTAGRADLYMGVGDKAERVAGRTRSEGQLYYLFLKQNELPWGP
jgi:membrane-bound lytic murein transglycosylase A